MRTGRRRQVVWAGTTAAILANGWRLRARLGHLAVLEDAPETAEPADSELQLVTAAGVTVDATTVGAALDHIRTQGLDVLDLVPGDLPLAPLLELVRLVDPKTYRQDSLVAGRGAGHATVVRTAVLERLDRQRVHDLDPLEYLELMVELKRYAPATTDLAVAPALQAVEPEMGWRNPRLRALYGGAMPAFVAVPAVSAAVLSAAPKLGRAWGAAALAAFTVQPYVATVRGPVRPRDLRLRSAALRAGREMVTPLRAALARQPAAAQERAEQAAADDKAHRSAYAASMEDADRFFEPRRADCPWCGRSDLQRLVTVPDLMQGKPGLFDLDECQACRLVFQNPRLSIEGLDFYYRDFYDGLQSEQTDFVFSTGGASYRGRAEMLQGLATPKRWLDVGAGHGHFCLTAKEVWPDTRFDGLDMGESILEAQRRGWVEHGYQGLLTDLAGDLTGAYDVVSMHHCLEHTRDPRAELDAAHTVLEAGGHLLVEVPDPDSKLGRRLGWLWGPWFQPQHQNMVPLGSLVLALRERGFEVLRTERGPAHQPVDIAFAFWLLANRVAPAGIRPWEPEPTVARRFARAATFAGFTPFLILGLAADMALAPLWRRIPGMSNTYRVLARKEGER